MLPGTVSQLLDPDRPRHVGVGDPLRRDRWVRVFEQQLKNIPITDSFVFSLEGPWGSGKTSVLDTIETDLKSHGMLVLRFNPWLFAGATDLVGAFFRELAAQLKHQQSRFKQLGKVFGALASMLGVVGLATANPVLGTLQGVAKSSSEALDKAADLQAVPSLLEAKRNFEKKLIESGIRLIVLVDDLERLRAKEALEVLRAVRVIADLPGLIYVLAFDREQLLKALEREGEDGLFLDKIIQVPMRLPSPPADALRALLFQKLDAVLVQVEHSELDHLRWSEAAREIVFPVAKTPRDVARLANAVAVALAHVGKRVALEDVIAMESLRVFEPRFFAGLIAHRTFLTAGDDTQVEIVRSMTRHDRNRATRSGMPPQAISIRESLLTLARDRRVCEDALKHLFPPLRDIDGVGSGNYDRRRARRSRRVCVTEVFDLYFEAEPRTEVLDLAFVAALAEVDAGRLPKAVESISQEQLEYLFNTLGDHAASLVQRQDLVAFVLTLLGHARNLPKRDPQFFVERPEVAPARFVHRVLGQLDGQDARQRFLDEICGAATPELAATVADVLLTIRSDADGLGLDAAKLDLLAEGLKKLVRKLDAESLATERATSWLLTWAYDLSDSAQKGLVKALLDDEALFAAFVQSALRRARYDSGHLEVQYRAEPFEGLFDDVELRLRLVRLVEANMLSVGENNAIRTALDGGKLVGRTEVVAEDDDEREVDGG